MFDLASDICYAAPEGGGVIMADVARIYRDKGGLYIYLEWQGKRHYVTTYMGLVSFRDNQLLAEKAKNTIDGEIDRGAFRPERWKTRSKKLFTVKGYAKTWLKKVEPELSTATHYDYCNSFKNHIYPVLGGEYLEDLTLDNLQDFMNNIDRVPKGKKNVMGALHRMLKHAYRSGHILQMPIFPEFKGKNAVVKPEIRWIEPTEQFKILEYISRPHRPIFTFIMLTGCRPSEARAFRKQDVKNSYIVFAVTIGRGGEVKEVKGKKILPFPLTESLKELFDTMPASLGPLMFPNPGTGRPYSKNINKIFNRAAKKAEVKIPLNNFGRHSFAMQTLQGLDKGMVSHLLRHQDPRTIEHYAEYQTAPLKSALDKIVDLKVLEKKRPKNGEFE